MQFITTKEAGEIIGVTSVRITQLCKVGQLAGEKIGRDWLIPEDAAKNFTRKPIGRPRKEY